MRITHFLSGCAITHQPQDLAPNARVPLEIPRKFLTMLLTFAFLNQFLTAVLKCLQTIVNNKLEIIINRVINFSGVKNC